MDTHTDTHRHTPYRHLDTLPSYFVPQPQSPRQGDKHRISKACHESRWAATRHIYNTLSPATTLINYACCKHREIRGNGRAVRLKESPSLHFVSNLFPCLVMACHFHMEAILPAFTVLSCPHLFFFKSNGPHMLNCTQWQSS